MSKKPKTYVVLDPKGNPALFNGQPIIMPVPHKVGGMQDFFVWCLLIIALPFVIVYWVLLLFPYWLFKRYVLGVRPKPVWHAPYVPTTQYEVRDAHIRRQAAEDQFPTPAPQIFPY